MPKKPQAKFWLAKDQINSDLLHLQVRTLGRVYFGLKSLQLITDEEERGLERIRSLGYSYAVAEKKAPNVAQIEIGITPMDIDTDVYFEDIRKGKELLVKMASCTARDGATRDANNLIGPCTIELLDGLVHWLDYVMDQAAEVFGKEMVFNL